MPVCHSDLFEAGGRLFRSGKPPVSCRALFFFLLFSSSATVLQAPIRALVAIAARSRHPGHRSCDSGAHSRRHARRQSLPTTARHGAPTWWWRPWRAPCSASQPGFGHRLWSHPPSIRPAIQLSQLWPDASPARPGPPALQLPSMRPSPCQTGQGCPMAIPSLAETTTATGNVSCRLGMAMPFSASLL